MATTRRQKPSLAVLWRRSQQSPWLASLQFVLFFGILIWLTVRGAGQMGYNWQWYAIPQYLWREVDGDLIWGPLIAPYLAYFDEDKQEWVANLLILGFVTTIRLALWGIVIAGIIGLVMGLCRTSNNLFLRMVARVYVEFVRNMPPLVFIFIFYFFVSSQLIPLLGVDDFVRNPSPTTLSVINVLFGDPVLFSNFVSGLICLCLFEGAYITEIVRAGVQAIPRGQWEAGNSVGLNKIDVLRFIIMPQAIQRIMPPLANQFIQLIKDSSIVSLISIQELTFMAIEVGVSTTRVFEVWITVAVFYFIVCYGCAYGFGKMEGRMATHRR